MSIVNFYQNDIIIVYLKFPFLFYMERLFFDIFFAFKVNTRQIFDINIRRSYEIIIYLFGDIQKLPKIRKDVNERSGDGES
jgi:hypothetical protein